MATGQYNNPNNPNRQNDPNRPNNQNNGARRPSNTRRRQKVPGAVIAIYVMMAVLVLAICALVFVVTLKATGWDGKNPNDSSGAVLENSSDSSQIIIPNSPADSPDNSDNSELSFSSYDSSDSSESSAGNESSDSSSSDVEWTSSGSDSSDSSSDSGGSWTVLPTDYDEAVFADDLFIGDSIFTGLHLYGYLDVKNVAAAVGYTPYKAMYNTFSQSYSGSAVDYAAERKPKRIFIMLGSNAMGAGNNYDLIITQYNSLIEMLKLNCPDSRICVISIPPVTSDSSSAASAKINNSDIDSVNVKLKAMAGSAKVTYFDLNKMLSDDNGYFIKDYAEMDGLHFKGATYKVLLSALQREVIKE